MFKLSKNRKWVGAAQSMAVIVLAATFCAPASASKEQLPEVSKDGLHLLKDTKVAIAYAKPGASLDPYTKLKILDCFVAFEKDWQRDYNMQELGLSGRVTDKDAEEIKTRLADEFRKEFTKQLSSEGYEIVDETGTDVLLVRPALINVDVVAPDVMSAGMQRTYVRSAGSMTLYMELYDSATSTLLARVIDPQADDGLAQQANRVTNKVAADHILRSWAKLLAKHLGEVTDEKASK